MTSCHRMLWLGWFLAVVAACSGSASTPTRPQPLKGAVWQLTAHLSEEQLRVNEQVHAGLPFDACDAENSFDAQAKELATECTPAALRQLRELEHSGDRQAQVAAARAYVFLALQAMAAGDREVAAQNSGHVYLSGAPHRLRLEALRVYCSCAQPDRSMRALRLIETGEQDARFASMLTELHAARLAASKHR